MSCGIVHILYGDYSDFLQFADRLIPSKFIYVYKAGSRRECFEAKTRLFDISPFDITAFVDVDVVNFADWGTWNKEIFDILPHNNIVLRNTHVLSNTSMLHYPNVKALGGIDRISHYDAVRWTTCGMICFRKTEYTRRIFERWNERYQEMEKITSNEEVSLVSTIITMNNPQPRHLPCRWNVNYNNTTAVNTNAFPIKECRLVHAPAGTLDRKLRALEHVLELKYGPNSIK